MYNDESYATPHFQLSISSAALQFLGISLLVDFFAAVLVYFALDNAQGDFLKELLSPSMLVSGALLVGLLNRHLSVSGRFRELTKELFLSGKMDAPSSLERERIMTLTTQIDTFVIRFTLIYLSIVAQLFALAMFLGVEIIRAGSISVKVNAPEVASAYTLSTKLLVCVACFLLTQGGISLVLDALQGYKTVHEEYRFARKVAQKMEMRSKEQ